MCRPTQGVYGSAGATHGICCVRAGKLVDSESLLSY